MKNRMFVGLVAAATALVLSSSLATAQEAYSANAIGVIKKTIPAGKMALISIPLDNTESTNAAIPFLELPFLSSLPNKSTANMWDSAGVKWVSGKKSLGKWGGDITNMYIHSGQSIFFENGGSSPVTLIFSGEVPSDAEISVGLAAPSHMVACANPYPVSFDFTNSVLARQAKNGSQANFWDMNANTWRFCKKSLGKWGGTASTVVEPGDGFMFQSGATETNTAWVVSKPYEWPVTAE